MRATGFGLLTVLAVGCGQARTDTYPVTGQVVGVNTLVGHTVEVALATDPTVRAYGTIGPDGRFTLNTFVDGREQSGVRPGRYDARLVLTDEGDGRSPKPQLPQRFLTFRGSGWAVEVPPPAEVKLTVTAR